MNLTAARAKASEGAERCFAAQVEKLTLGEGEVFHGENILAITKALLQAGVSYVGGYPGAPVSHLMDVLADARDRVLEPLGVQFEASANEAGAAALLGASIHYPLRGAVTWKSIVGTNVASDGLSNLASAGVTGGVLIIVGEDYGEGASVIQERSHATAMKSSMPMLDPRYNMPRLVELTEQAFELSEACHLPVLMSLRIRAAHMTGRFVCKDNRPPRYNRNHPFPEARYDYGRIVLPPSTYAHEKAKVEERLPAARRFIVEHEINEWINGSNDDLGIILQGGTWGVVLRGLRLLGAADALGSSDIPLLILNAIHPLVPEQIERFIQQKRHVLIIEEGNPAFIEQQVRALAQRSGSDCQLWGKGLLPEAGEYVADVVRDGLARWLAAVDPDGLGARAAAIQEDIGGQVAAARQRLQSPAPPRPPSFCTGCPERPLFTALKLLMRERGPIHVASDIGCNTFATLPPFNIGSTVLGYGMSLASGGAVGPALGQPTVAVMGDGAFWHNGLITGAANAHWNQHDAVLIIIDNGYASATGQQHVPSTGSTPWGTPIQLSIEKTLRGMGIDWIRRVNAYRVSATLKVLRQALDEPAGLRVVISDQECRLARQRRERRQQTRRISDGQAVSQARFGVDQEVCSGDHSCMRLSGCPSLTLNNRLDPLQQTPTARVDDSCVDCGLCGEAAHAVALCPSFYRAERRINPTLWQRLQAQISSPLMKLLGAS